MTTRPALVRALRAATSSPCSLADADFDSVRFEQQLADNSGLAFAESWHWIRVTAATRAERGLPLAHHGRLARWAMHCPDNFADCAALVGAEIARIEDRELDAERLYEEDVSERRALVLRALRRVRKGEATRRAVP